MEKIKYVIINKEASLFDSNDWAMRMFAEYVVQIYLNDIFDMVNALKKNDEYYNFWRNEMYVDYYADDYYVIGDPSTGSYNGYDPVPEGMLWIKRDQFIKMLQTWYDLRSKGITEIMITKDGDNFEMHEIV